MSCGRGASGASGYLLAVVLAGVSAWTCAFAEPPHLDFVRGLRQRGFADLALEYLEKLQKDTSLPEAVRTILPLEIARTQAALSQAEEDPSARQELLQRARKGIEGFLQAHPDHPAAGEALVELGRILLDHARRLQAEKATTDAGQSEQVRQAFDQADRILAAASARLKPAATSLDPKKKSYDRAAVATYLQALYLQGETRFAKAQTFSADDEKTIVARGETLSAAVEVLQPFAELAFRDQPYAWLGLTLLARCYDELDKRDLAQKYYDLVVRERPSDIVIPAQRLVRYYQIQAAFENRPFHQGGKPKDKPTVIELAQAWLNDFKNDAQTREGQHIQLMLAATILRDLQQVPTAQRAQATHQRQVDRALNILDPIQSRPGEFRELARQLKLQLLAASGRAAQKKIHDLATFDECFVRAQIEAESIRQLIASLGKLEKEEDKQHVQQQILQHWQAVVAALRRGLPLVPPGAPVRDIQDAWGLLAEGYAILGDYYRASVAAEHLAEVAGSPQVARSAAGAALRWYQQLLSRDAQARRADIQRMIGLAKRIVERWPSSPQADQAREILGRAAYQDGQFAQGASFLEKVSPSYPRYAYCSYLAAVGYWNVHVQQVRQKQQPLRTPTPERDKAVGLLERSLKAFEKANELDEQSRSVWLPAALMLAQLYQFQGENARALAVLEPWLQKLQKKDTDSISEENQPRLLILGLDLYVREKQLDRALALLKTLEARAEGSHLTGDLDTILRQLGEQMRARLASLEQQGAEAAKELEAVRANYREFLHFLDRERTKLSPELQLWLGTGFSYLGEHDKAYEIFSALASPQGQQQHAVVYRQSLLYRVRALRESKRFAEAKKELDALSGQSWAKTHPEIIKERILWLQDQGLYSGPQGAIAQWNAYIRALEPRVRQGGPVRALYYDAHYHLLYCKYMEAVSLQDKHKRQEALRSVAQLYLTLKRNEFGGPEFERRFRQFYEAPEQKELREVVETLQKQGGTK
ncbi:MAG: hypothetical protein C4297_14250 [Gemmataceae bacterium]